jgi:hypothetical protein
MRFRQKGVLLRLISQGLDRHEAIHAIGSVLSETLYTAMNEQVLRGDLNQEYVEKLKSLTAESWRRQAM